MEGSDFDHYEVQVSKDQMLTLNNILIKMLSAIVNSISKGKAETSLAESIKIFFFDKVKTKYDNFQNKFDYSSRVNAKELDFPEMASNLVLEILNEKNNGYDDKKKAEILKKSMDIILNCECKQTKS